MRSTATPPTSAAAITAGSSGAVPRAKTTDARAAAASPTAAMTESAPTARTTSPRSSRDSAGSCTTTSLNDTSRETGQQHSRTPYPPRTFTSRSSVTMTRSYPTSRATTEPRDPPDQKLAIPSDTRMTTFSSSTAT